MQALQLILCNERNVIEIVNRRLDKTWNIRGKSPLFLLRGIISSPRLADVYVRNYPTQGLRRVADSYLSDNSLLSDLPHASFGIELKDWREQNWPVVPLNEVRNHHQDLIRLQIWPFDPNDLTEEQMALAVAVSFTDQELFEEPRLSGAIEEILAAYNVDCEFKYSSRS